MVQSTPDRRKSPTLARDGRGSRGEPRRSPATWKRQGEQKLQGKRIGLPSGKLT